MDDAATDVDLDVDVHGPAPIPTRVEGLERRHATRVRLLDAAQEVRAGAAGDGARVHAESVAVPDFDRRVPDRLAGRRVQDGQAEQQGRARLALGDIASQLLSGDVVRTFGQLRRQDARDEAGRDGAGAGAGGIGGFEAPRCTAAGGGSDARQAQQRTAPGETFVLDEVVLAFGHDGHGTRVFLRVRCEAAVNVLRRHTPGHGRRGPQPC